jgi:cell wall-associated NlpC family hydrolase
MRYVRILLAVLALSFALVLSLLRPLPSRADEGSGGALPNPTSAENPRAAEPPANVAMHPRHRRPTRKLASARHALAFGVRVVDYAKHLIGVPYSYGGSSPRSGFDCSGFVRYVYAHFGVSLPHSSFADIVRGRRVGRWQMRPGDLVFFDSAGHVGIYVGHDRFIHAPHTGTVVRISTMAGWYSTRFTGARRIG